MASSGRLCASLCAGSAKRSSSGGESEDDIGPAFASSLEEGALESSDIDAASEGPGPNTSNRGQCESSNCNDMYGPALPPGFKPSPVVAEKPVVGPTLPPGLSRETLGNLGDDLSSALSDFTDVIGPLPPTSAGHSSANDDVYEDFERRASKMKKKLTGCSDEELKREEWMTVLPPELGKNFGLGPRSFRRQAPVPLGDRSVWTDMPSQKLEKEQLQHDAEADDAVEKCPVEETTPADAAREIYDKAMSSRIEKYNKSGKRTKTLLEIHQKNLKKKKKEEKDKVVERKPFDREVDLKVNLIDDAKRDALIKKSRQLNDKFSHGKGQFL